MASNRVICKENDSTILFLIFDFETSLFRRWYNMNINISWGTVYQGFKIKISDFFADTTV